MAGDRARIRALLQQRDLKALFIEGLGWDHYNGTLEVVVEEQAWSLEGVAEKRGMVAYRCPTPPGQAMPNAPTRYKIERQVAKLVREHIITFTDGRSGTQVW